MKRHKNLIFISALLGLLSLPSWGAQTNKKTLLLLDLNSPFEINTWIEVLGLSKDKCLNSDGDLCNSEFIAYRPLRKSQDPVDVIAWLAQTKIKPEAIFISGHHSRGFFGKLGRLPLAEVYNLATTSQNLSVFLNPRLVYLGGCYTVQSKFTEQERDPVAYLTRVLTHTEMAQPELMVSAIQQIANGGNPNPWGPYFPNATLLGYDERGPGDKSEANIKDLITHFASHVKLQERTLSFSKALFRLIEESDQKNLSASSAGFMNLGKWWAYDGRQVSETNSAAFVPDKFLNLTQIKLEPVPNQGQSTATILANILNALLRNDVSTAPWIANIDSTARAQIIVDISNIVSYSSLDENMQALLENAALTTIQTTSNGDLFDIAFGILNSMYESDDFAKKMMSWLQSSEVNKRAAALDVLGRLYSGLSDELKPKVLEALKGLTNDPNQNIKQNAIWAYGQNAESRNSVAQSLRDPNPTIRETTALFYMEGGTDDVEAQLSLVRLLSDKHNKIAEYSQMALESSKITDSKVFDSLLSVLHSPSPQLRKNTLPILKEYLTDNKVIRSAVLNQLLNDPRPDVRVEIISILPRSGTDIKASLLKEVSNINVDVKCSVIGSLLRMEDLEDVSIFESIIFNDLKDPSPLVKKAVLSGLQSFFSRNSNIYSNNNQKFSLQVSSRIKEAFVDSINSTDTEISNDGMFAINFTGVDAKSFPKLLSYTKSPIEHVRDNTFSALARMRPLSPEVQLAAIHGFTDKSERVRLSAYSALWEATADYKNRTQLTPLVKQQLEVLVKQNNKLAVEFSGYVQGVRQ